MANASDFLENRLARHVLNGDAYASPATIYLALSTANPTDSGSGMAEPVGNGYARVALVAAFTVVGGDASNSSPILFPTATGAWGTITHFAIFDAASGGNMLVHGALASPVGVVTGTIFRFAAGDLDVAVQ